MSVNNGRPRPARKLHVVVIGGGYAGALAANRLQQNRDIQITIVNPRPVFVERVRLHELVARSGDATVDLAGLLGKGVDLVVDTATKINATTRTVELESGSQIAYDYLIYAVGSTGTVPESVLGARDYAYPIGELEQAERLRAEIDRLPVKAPLCVVGGGLTGIEAASELAEQRPGAKVTLLCGGVLAPSVGEKARASVRKQLTKLGVTVDDEAVVAEVLLDRVRLSDGRSIPSAATVWTAGFGVPDLAARSGLTTDGIGRLVTDETLTSVDDPWIIGAGDASAPAGPSLRMSCQAAMPLAARATSTVLARIAGEEVKVLNQSFVGSNISIGRRHGTIAAARQDDSPRSFYIGGRLAAFIKEMVCTTVVKQIVKEGRRPGSYSWPGANKRPDSVQSLSR